MIDHSDEEVEEQRCAATLHLHLHGTAALESVARADDESEVMGTQLRVGSWGAVVGETSRRQDRAALDARLETLFLESEALKVW